MKYIHKSGAPRAYTQWCARVRGTKEEDYNELRSPEKDALHSALVREQGGLCAYTMRRIDESSSHIEHVKPYSLCRTENPKTDLDYRNLVACFPRLGMKKLYRYGAQAKGNWWQNDGNSFVSPLHPSCEARFKFDLDGEINAVDHNAATLNTIKVLALDHDSLTEDRKRVIDEFIYGAEGDKPLSQAEAEDAATSICNRNQRHEFYEFCVAIRHALGEYLRLLRKNVQRSKALRRRT